MIWLHISRRVYCYIQHYWLLDLSLCHEKCFQSSVHQPKLLLFSSLQRTPCLVSESWWFSLLLVSALVLFWLPSTSCASSTPTEAPGFLTSEWPLWLFQVSAQYSFILHFSGHWTVMACSFYSPTWYTFNRCCWCWIAQLGNVRRGCEQPRFVVTKFMQEEGQCSYRIYCEMSSEGWGEPQNIFGELETLGWTREIVAWGNMQSKGTIIPASSHWF